MPLLKIETNSKIEPDEERELLLRASQATAEILQKPERYVMVSFTHNPAMCFAGSMEPLAYLELKSLGLPDDRSVEISRILCRLVSDALRIPAERIYIEMSAPPRHLWGWNEGTF